MNTNILILHKTGNANSIEKRILLSTTNWNKDVALKKIHLPWILITASHLLRATVAQKQHRAAPAPPVPRGGGGSPAGRSAGRGKGASRERHLASQLPTAPSPRAAPEFSWPKAPRQSVFAAAPAGEGRFPGGQERAAGTRSGGGSTERAGRRDPALLPAGRPGGCAGMHPRGVLGRSQLCFRFIIKHIKGHHAGPVSARPGLQFSAQWSRTFLHCFCPFGSENVHHLQTPQKRGREQLWAAEPVRLTKKIESVSPF